MGKKDHSTEIIAPTPIKPEISHLILKKMGCKARLSFPAGSSRVPRLFYTEGSSIYKSQVDPICTEPSDQDWMPARSCNPQMCPPGGWSPSRIGPKAAAGVQLQECHQGGRQGKPLQPGLAHSDFLSCSLSPRRADSPR